VVKAGDNHFWSSDAPRVMADANAASSRSWAICAVVAVGAATLAIR
jgi:hypothetical protein